MQTAKKPAAARTRDEHFDEWLRLSDAYHAASVASSAALASDDLAELDRTDAVRVAAYERMTAYRQRWLAR